MISLKYRYISMAVSSLFLFYNIGYAQLKSNVKHPLTKKYIIVKNDSLWKISGKQLNNPYAWKKIYHTNTYIKSPNLIYPINTLLIPYSNKTNLLLPSWFLDIAYGTGINGLPHENAPPNTAGWGSDIYRADGIANTPITSLAIGYQWLAQRHWFPSYSLAVRYTYLFSTQIDGRISLMGGQFPNCYHYSYRINAQNIMAIAKFDIYNWHQFKPYITIGIGGSRNTFSNYNENVIVGPKFRPEIPPGYNKKTTNNLAYSLGAGFTYQWSKHWQTGFEYQWQNLGDIESTYGKNTYYNDRLSQDYKLQTLMFHLIYLF